MKIGLFVTRAGGRFEALLKELEAARIPYEIAGWDLDLPMWRLDLQGNSALLWGSRLKFYADFCKKERGKVLLLDAWDHRLLSSREEIEAKLERHRFVFAAEWKCWPDEENWDLWPRPGTDFVPRLCVPLSSIPSIYYDGRPNHQNPSHIFGKWKGLQPYRVPRPKRAYKGFGQSQNPEQGNRSWWYINGGSLAGDAPYMYDCLHEAGLDQLEGIPLVGTDQREYHFMFYKAPEKFTLDYDQELFQCTFGECFEASETAPATLEMRNGRWTNTVTGATPCFIHGNGKSSTLEEKG